MTLKHSLNFVILKCHFNGNVLKKLVSFIFDSARNYSVQICNIYVELAFLRFTTIIQTFAEVGNELLWNKTSTSETTVTIGSLQGAAHAEWKHEIYDY